MADSIERKLSEAGYRILGGREIENLILSLLKEGDPRFLKAIPFLIYLHNPDLDLIHAKAKDKKLLGGIIGITRKIFEEEGILRKLPLLDQKTGLNFEEFKQEFELQKRSSEKPDLLAEKEKIYAERNLQMQLSQLFTKKEKFILQRILGEKPVSRTDYEYYSRKTKKKLNAIIHLRNFAESILPLSPKIDKELFELKKLLEEWGEREGYRGYSLARFIAAGNVLSISLKGKKGGQRHTVLLKNSSKINNKRLRELAEKYQGHNFEE